VVVVMPAAKALPCLQPKMMVCLNCCVLYTHACTMLDARHAATMQRLAGATPMYAQKSGLISRPHSSDTSVCPRTPSPPLLPPLLLTLLLPLPALLLGATHRDLY
jgi:hypothetical protein